MAVLLNPWWTDAVAPLHQGTFPRLLLALALGICIGAERQWRQRAAGLGAAAFVDLGLTIAPNTTQVVAYVVSGVGFLGAGAIMKDGANVRGLNTAATLWCSAAVGACAGAGELLDAIFVAALLFGVNSLLRPLSRVIDRYSLASVETQTLYRVRVVCASDQAARVEHLLTHAVANHALALRELRCEAIEDTTTTLVQAVIEASTRDESIMPTVLKELRQDSAVESADSLLAEHEAE